MTEVDPAARPVLVILRAGDRSLHPGWLAGAPPETRTWDLHLSYFGNDPDPFPDRPADVTVSFEKGSKATGTVACLAGLGARLDRYRFIWLPDDDLAADLPTLNRFFAIVAEYDLDIAQPALGPGSFVNHRITSQRPEYRLRFTDFAEIMALGLSQRAFRICRPYFDRSVSSWGLDFLFPKLIGYPDRKIAIVDETPVVHTRPGGKGPNIALVRGEGVTPGQELRQIEKDFGIVRSRKNLAAIPRGGGAPIVFPPAKE
ncbi:hypothetical protein C2U72_09310 [Prosthecomicrobium hirschii]|uniref:DUF707 domain-containing protein n=1 Tax=Prosthecodimorpha hirschii TaxID=665126 RepID=UPI0011299C43|nr:DUF707 domain-containing protein [Prosthecomicrobium hirschii]TPQ51251.1 hypothetical protein C2U72_09310 [Prosthecomicrobium hirschii]